MDRIKYISGFHQFKIFQFLFLFTLLFQVGFSQKTELPMPANIKKAYLNNTRSFSGKPGDAYWQNKADYDIHVKLTPSTKIIEGEEKIVYYNNSSETLNNIAIRFVNNILKTNPKAKNENKLGLDISYFSIDNYVYNINSEKWGTVELIELKNQIKPKSSVEIIIKWTYQLSVKHGRGGQIDSTTFFASYSYPRVSVFDDYNGWDLLPHNGRLEFYNDFNDYKLSVTVPKDYVVWATGDLLNADEVLKPEISDRLKSSFTSDSIIKIANSLEMKEGNVTKPNEWNTWKFSAKHITDMCFATSKNYVWDASSLIVDDLSKRRVSIQTAYNDTAIDFSMFTNWAQESLLYFSKTWPGVPYPFSKMTSFQGFSDMEYPMMVNDKTEPNLKFSQLIQNHEIVHTYFPFYMGINESRYAYMDEGWATTFEYLICTEQNGKAFADSIYKEFRVNRIIKSSIKDQTEPIMAEYQNISPLAFGSNVYGKASLSYLALKDMLGDDLFKKALHYYMNTWNGKHPIPWDYFNCMNKGSGKDLNWFFHNWFYESNYMDLKIESVRKSKKNYNINILNVGGFAIPFDLIIELTDGSVKNTHYTPKTWEENRGKKTISIPYSKNIKTIKLNGGIFMDYSPDDNVWKR